MESAAGMPILLPLRSTLQGRDLFAALLSTFAWVMAHDDAMLSLLFALTVLLSIGALSAGSPASFHPSSNLWGHPERGFGGAYFCTGTDWTGLCDIAITPYDTCNELLLPWRKHVASFTPSPCTLCFAYETRHCSFGKGFFWMFQYPGNATGGIGVPNNAWNRRLESFKCWRSPDCEPT
ncbi:hypothetical protein C8Q76DRAFT_754397 [Earliella scabrosa]|nr:hypothetical protein C8Q76DRAFT_754397 [Earliella scabrosa]